MKIIFLQEQNSTANDGQESSAVAITKVSISNGRLFSRYLLAASVSCRLVGFIQLEWMQKLTDFLSKIKAYSKRRLHDVNLYIAERSRSSASFAVR